MKRSKKIKEVFSTLGLIIYIISLHLTPSKEFTAKIVDQLQNIGWWALLIIVCIIFLGPIIVGFIVFVIVLSIRRRTEKVNITTVRVSNGGHYCHGDDWPD